MKITYLDEALCVATSENIFVNLWSGEVTASRLYTVRDSEKAFASTLPGGKFFLLTLIRRPGKMMTLDAAARNASYEISAELAPLTIAHSEVILGTGFWVATARAFIAAMNMAMRNPFPLKVCEDVHTGAEWLSEQMRMHRQPCAPAQLVELARVVQAAFDERNPRVK